MLLIPKFGILCLLQNFDFYVYYKIWIFMFIPKIGFLCLFQKLDLYVYSKVWINMFIPKYQNNPINLKITESKKLKNRINILKGETRLANV